MKVTSIAECSKGSAILSTFIKLPFRELSLRSLFCQFLSGGLRQVLLYIALHLTLKARKPDFVSMQSIQCLCYLLSEKNSSQLYSM